MLHLICLFLSSLQHLSVRDRKHNVWCQAPYWLPHPAFLSLGGHSGLPLDVSMRWKGLLAGQRLAHRPHHPLLHLVKASTWCVDSIYQVNLYTFADLLSHDVTITLPGGMLWYMSLSSALSLLSRQTEEPC